MRRKTRKFIYIVEVWYDYESLDIIGAFESKEEAQKAVDYCNRQPDVLDGASINHVTVYSDYKGLLEDEREWEDMQ